MTALLVIICILLVLFLLSLIRVGASASYSEQGFRLAVKVGVIRIQIFPLKKAEKKKRGKADSRHPADAGAKPVQGKKPKDTVTLALRFVPLLGEFAGRLRRKIRIDRLVLRVIWGASDPAAAARGYGAGNAVLGIVWPIIEHNFHVKDYDLRVDVDFDRQRPEFAADAQITLTIGQGVALVFYLGIQALKIYLGYRREKNEQKAVQL